MKNYFVHLMRLGQYNLQEKDVDQFMFQRKEVGSLESLSDHTTFLMKCSKHKSKLKKEELVNCLKVLKRTNWGNHLLLMKWNNLD